MATNGFSEITSFIWSVADLIRGPYRPNQYKDVMLPLTTAITFEDAITFLGGLGEIK
jgi:type I restriction enzyme M protein